jgi:DNA-directed RNA polymerase II subunit RPB1
MAVCEITNPRSFEDNGIPTEGGINDLRMGTTDKKLRCATCKCNFNDCPGHFGYIHLDKPVFHVGFINECLKLLKCVCWKCSRVLIDDYQKYEEIAKIKNPKVRHLKIYNICKTKKQCKERKKRREENNDNNDGNDREDNYENDEYYKPGCGEFQPKFTRENLQIIMDISEIENQSTNETKRAISPQEVLNIFSNIPLKEMEFLGFNPKYSQPQWMIIQNLAVCPPQVRPSVSVDSSLRSQDDLTHQYNQILKANKELKSESSKGSTDITSENKFNNLQFNVATLMNNDLTSGRAHKKSGQPIKAIYARLKGKEGRVRGNLMGKRVDYSARSVISPDPNLQVDELGVPLSIAMNLTFPEVVTDLNIEKLKKLVSNGPNKYPGAKMIKSNDGKTVIDLRYCKNTTDEHLEKGYIVERHMQNGDYVIFNRQPSLHKMSMMGHRVHILPYSTFRLNLSVTTPYNADFDGDEMNMHLPQSLESKSEIMNIMHVPKQIVSPQSNRPVMGIVQDTLIGCKLFTARDTFLNYEQTMNLVMWIDDFDIRNLPMPCIMKPQPLWSGKQIFSLILPEKLNLTRFREDTPAELVDKLNLIDNFVQIKKGELLQGIICKKTVGASSGGIIHNIWTEVSPQKTIEFLGNCQKIVNNFLLLTGWTVGISDIICDPDTSEEVFQTLKEMKENISSILTKAQTGKLDSQPGKNMIDSFESMANSELNNAREKAGILVQKSLLPKNHLKNMVSAGSKGNSTNISQIIAFVGQQNVEGKRIPFNFQNRTLPHFLKDDYKSESKGFVENSFLKGLTPQEFYFHAMGGREGIIDTAVKTSQTGYIQRRLVKALEDIMIKYDGTVRNSVGHLMQFLYGEDGMAGEYIEDQKFETLKMDDKTLILNYKFIERDEDEFNFFNDLKRFMEDSVIEDLRRQDLSQLRLDLEIEFEQIKSDRDYMRKTLLASGDNSINIPVNIKTIITYAENDNNINIFSKSDLNPLIVLQKVKELKKELEIIKGTDKISVEGQECALTLFNMVLNYSLSTKNIITKHRLNRKAFDFVCGEIKSKFEQAIVRPGEMVGSIAAQSIGEPATQMTLNTFHLAGVSSVNVTLGVPRLKEVINIAKKLNTPSMSIYLKEKEDGYNNDEILALRGKVEHTSLLNIVSLSEIYYDPDIKNTIIAEDREMIEEYMEIWEDEINNNIDNISPWLLRLVLNKDYINIRMETIEEIIKKKAKKQGALIIHTRETSDEKKFHIRLECSNDMEQEKKQEYKSLDSLKYSKIAY